MATAWQATGWVSVTEEAAILILHLGGELDLRACDSLGPALDAAIRQAQAVDVDLGEVTFCDSSGLALLINASTLAETLGTRFAVRRARPRIRRVFALAGLQYLLRDT